MVNFKNMVLLAPQNKNQYVKLRFQFLKEGIAIMTEAGKGEEGLDDSLEFMESLHNHMEQEGITHDANTMNCKEADRIDNIFISLAPSSEPVVLKEKNYKYTAMNAKGKEKKGIVMAKSTTEAINKLRDMGYFPTKVEEKKP